MLLIIYISAPGFKLPENVMSSAYLVYLMLLLDVYCTILLSIFIILILDKYGLVGAPCGNFLSKQHKLAKNHATLSK